MDEHRPSGEQPGPQLWRVQRQPGWGGAVVVGPTQPLAVGVIVNVTVIGAKVVLVNVPLISPDPLAAMPVTVPVLSLVQV